MTRRIVTLLALLALTACGVDGPPQAPAGPGVSVSGDAQIGMRGEW